MKKYNNISKYFNTNPRLWIIILGIIAAIPLIPFILVVMKGTVKTICYPFDKFPCDIIVGIVAAVCMLAMGIGIFYLCRFLCLNLVTSSISSSLRKRGYDVAQCLDEIESELEAPVLAQIHRGINKSVDFVITQNWIVGTDDLFFMCANAVRISEIVSADLNEIDTYSVSQGTIRNQVNTKHYVRVKLTDRDNRIYCFTVLNEECQREAYDYITKNILAHADKEMLVKKEKLGYEPIKYERGERNDREYKSKCLEYCFNIPDGCVLKTNEELEGESTPQEITELFAQMPSGVNAVVDFSPLDGSVKDINIDYLGKSMVESTNRKCSDRKATHYGTIEFLGKQCAHSMVELDKNGIHFLIELYTYFAPYCRVMFIFTYAPETRGDADILKQAFRDEVG